MSNVKYSLLIASYNIDKEMIKKMLHEGIKIIYFTGSDNIDELKNAHEEFVTNRYLQLYVLNKKMDIQICDGIIPEHEKGVLSALEKSDNRFNLEQYLVEHADKNTNLCVEAGAGTGKTHVMVNRILYLMHIDNEFDFSKVAMITFTNKATDNMRHKLLHELNNKYKLTGKQFYLEKLEEVSQIQISTIHSFFKKILLELGPILGYGTSLSLRSYTQEKKEILKDILNEKYRGNSKSVSDELGLTLNGTEKLAFIYWVKLVENGLTQAEIENLDWGKASEERANKIQKQLKNIFEEVERRYAKNKFLNNAISMKDIIQELGKVIYNPIIRMYLTSDFKYIFCDEFQDSDNVQIKTITQLSDIYKCSLFVVGDIKQSIYRFRGATDSAFERLKNNDKGIEFNTYSLKKNYRTSRTIMNQIDEIFREWDNRKYLIYRENDRLVPQNLEQGDYVQVKTLAKYRQEVFFKIIEKIREKNKNAVITVLTRNNMQLKEVKSWCEEKRRVCHIKEKGTFFSSVAVLDFCSLLEALLYDNEPIYMHALTQSAYLDSNVVYDDLTKLDGNRFKLLSYYNDKMEWEKWDEYRQSIKRRPILSVIREIIEESSPVQRFLQKSVILYKKNGYTEEDAMTQAIVDTMVYDANLQKLLQMLQEQFGGEICTLYDVCSYLRMRINTDTNEEQAEVEIDVNEPYIEGYTVHSAKGLEFDYVIMPFMNTPFVNEFRSEILISEDNNRVGWIYRSKNGDLEIFNDNHRKMKMVERMELLKDETRLLYVAMTRAKKGLYCMPSRTMNVFVNDWASLLPKGKDDENYL